MYTLKGIFPEPKKEQKKNFIRENMKQLKYLQGKVVKDPKLTVKSGQPPRSSGLSPTNSLGRFKKPPQNNPKIGSTKSLLKKSDLHLRKGDMAEFLKRKQQRHRKTVEEETSEPELQSDSSGNVRDIACQTVESTLSQRFAESTKLTMLYPKKEDDSEAKQKASGDTVRYRTPRSPNHPRMSQVSGDSELFDPERRTKLNSILERKDKDNKDHNKDPYLPTGYQKGVVPKYLRERREAAPETAGEGGGAACPPGHVTLPDTERKETLRMLRSSFAELVNELNKMPVKTDTLRMRNRKMELEKQLAKLEEGIKVFSRPKVFVKIGE